FCGYQAIDDNDGKQHAKAFHDAWLQNMPAHLRISTQKLIQRLFPRLESVWSNWYYSGESLQGWRAELRVCVPDIFPAYFRLSLPAGAVTRADVDALLAAANDSCAFASILRSALGQKTASGTSKARALLERLMDHVPDGLDASHVQTVIDALLDMGDELLVRTDRIPGEFDFGNELRVARVAYHLLKKVDHADRCRVVSTALTQGRALRCGQRLVGSLASEVDKETKGEGGPALVRAEDVGGMKSAWMSRVEVLSSEPTFINHPSLAVLLSGWSHWGGEAQARAWWATAANTDEGLTKLIAAFQSESTSHSFGDRAARVHLRVNPKAVAPYGDAQVMAARLQTMLDAGQVAQEYLPAVRQFVLECERMKAGKDPESFDFDD
ncbi:MAG: NTPase, partial [Proteobacteria bacterium]|nr:NTPase [Pseudomonadota bacterium]